MNVGADRVGGTGSTNAETDGLTDALGHGNGRRNTKHLDHRGVGRQDIEAGEDATEVDAVAGGFQLGIAEIGPCVDIATDGVFTVDGRNGEGNTRAATLAKGEGTTGGICFDPAVVVGVDREGADLDFAIGAAFDIFNFGGEGIINGIAGHHQAQTGSASTTSGGLAEGHRKAPSEGINVAAAPAPGR